MSLNQRVARIEDRLSRRRDRSREMSEAETTAFWEERLPMLSDQELDQLEAVYAKFATKNDFADKNQQHWLHDILAEPGLSSAEREQIVSIFMTMRIDLEAMASGAQAQ